MSKRMMETLDVDPAHADFIPLNPQSTIAE